MFGSLDVSTSALVAQRIRMDTISANLANQHTTHDADGNYAPYRRRIAMFAQGDPDNGLTQGVHVSEITLDQSPFQKIFEPGHPDADGEGYIEKPNIDPVIEMVNALVASRAYEANITAAEASKSMMNSAIGLLAS